MKPSGYWTEERLAEEALKYNTKTDLIRANESAYQAIRAYNKKNPGFLNKVCSHMKVLGSKFFRFVYVFEFEDKSAYIGLTYNVKRREYDHLRKETSKVYIHIKETNYKYNLFTLNENPILVEDAQELEHETKLKYIKNGWNVLNEGSTGRGIGSIGGNNLKWNKDKCIEEALQFNHRWEFQKKSQPAYRSASNNGWLDECCSHMDIKIKPPGYWTKENVFKEALKYDTPKEFAEFSRGAYDVALDNDWIKEIRTEIFNVKNNLPRGYWTEDRCIEEISLYNKRCDLIKYSNNCYIAIKKKKWFHLIEHLDKSIATKIWFYDNTKEESLKYSYKYAFRCGSPTAHHVAEKNGWLDEFFPKKKFVIMQKDIHDNVINEFSSVKEASKKLNIHNGNITNVINGKRKFAGGFKFVKKII